MTKKWRLLVAVIAAFALLASACGDDSDDAADDTGGGDGGDGISVALVMPGEINDLSWNQQMYSGAKALEDEGLISELSYTELVPEGDAERAIRGYAEDGIDLIVAHSFGYGEAMPNRDPQTAAAPAASPPNCRRGNTAPPRPCTRPALAGRSRCRPRC